jgi:hypothetical protein
MGSRDIAPWTLVAQVKPLLVIDSIHLLVIDVPTLTSQKDINPPITIPDTNLGDIPDPLAQYSVVLDRFVVIH